MADEQSTPEPPKPEAMTRERALELLKTDVPAWNKWRVKVDLWNVLSSGTKVELPDLRNASLLRAKLRDADLSGAHLEGAILLGARLEGAILFRAHLEGANLRHAHLEGANLVEAHLEKANLFEAHLEKANLGDSCLSGANLSGADLTTAYLSGANLGEANLEGANLVDAHLEEAILAKAHLEKANLRGADVSGADLSEAHLEGANLVDAHLQKAKLYKANLEESDLHGVIVDPQTNFQGATVVGCVIDRYTLESLDDYGGLSRADRMRMNIEDGLAKLRSSFSGFLQYLHVTALVVFVFPYVSFVLRHWTAAKFGLGDDEKTISLAEALLRYIVGGGAGWREGWSLSWAFGLFLLLLVYNFARAGLLWKTKKLELEQEARGLPVEFSLTGFWYGLYQVASIGFWVNVFVVFLHTAHFLWQRIPVNG